jgi:putative ATPase
MELFEAAQRKGGKQKDWVPLAERMRPEYLDDFVGQEHLLGPSRFLRTLIEKDQLQSLIFWGPPGTGKTTLAAIIARSTRSHFLSFSAVLSGVKEIRQVIQEAEEQRYHGRRTILFVDEIHRFNKSQQDAFLHAVEQGIIVLIGATTENPSFEVNSALLSRCKVLTLRGLTSAEIRQILEKALEDPEKGLGLLRAGLAPEAMKHLSEMSHGDARVALNALEAAVYSVSPDREGRRVIPLPIAEEAMQRKALLYDQDGEEHYNIISAFHKSLRGSDPDAALYWLARMIEAGEDPLYVARRMVRFASEDVGLADTQALSMALMSMEAFQFLGHPEGDLALAEAAVYLATAPKSNAVYVAYDKARKDVAEKGALPTPLHIRNAPTKLMKDLGYGQGYKYAHDYSGAIVPQDYFPEGIGPRIYYQPTNRGYEKTVAERLAAWRQKLGRKN